MKSVLQSRVFVSEVGVSERTCDSPPQHTCSCSTCHSRVTSPVYNSSHRASNGKSYHVHVVLYWNFGVKGKGTQLKFLFSNFLSKKKKSSCICISVAGFRKFYTFWQVIGWNYICINNLYFFLYSLFLSP